MSTLHVENLKGLSSGGNANKIIVPSGQTLDASNGFTAPAGHVIQVVHADSNTTTTWSQSNTRSALYGTGVSNRAYVEGASLTITPKSTSNILYCTASVGWSNFSAAGPTQANGSIITLNDTTSIDPTDYPYYQAHNWIESTGAYWPSEQVIGTFSPNSTSTQTLRVRPYIYWEHSGSSNGKIIRTKLVVMEISQ